jgi:hypothetical protein
VRQGQVLVGFRGDLLVTFVWQTKVTGEKSTNGLSSTHYAPFPLGSALPMTDFGKKLYRHCGDIDRITFLKYFPRR